MKASPHREKKYILISISRLENCNHPTSEGRIGVRAGNIIKQQYFLNSQFQSQMNKFYQNSTINIHNLTKDLEDELIAQ